MAILHLALLVGAVGLYMKRGILHQDLMTFVSTSLPVLGTLTPITLRHFLSSSQPRLRDEPALSIPLAVGALFFPSFFAAASGGALLAKALHWGLNSSDDLRLVLISIQSVVGIYAGQLLIALFGEPGAQGTNTPAGSSDEELLRAKLSRAE